jgi:hypothetical protein
MNAPKHTQVGAERRASALAGVAVDVAAALAVIIPCPLVHTVGNSGMARMAPPIALPRIGMEPCAARGDVLRDQGRAGAPICMVAHPEALLTHVPRDEADNRRAVVGVAPMPSPLIGTPPGRISGIAMGRTLFPRRFGRVRLPQRPYRSSRWSAPSRSGGLGGAAAGYAAVYGTALTRGPGGPWAHPWPCRAAAAPGWPVVGGFPRRRSP